MKLSEFYKILDTVAPKSISDEYCAKYGAYDNSGVLVDTGEEIRGAVFSLDLNFKAIDEAIKQNANLIVTHHPAIYGKISDIRACDFSPLGEKLVKCIKHGISVIAMHLNLDCAKGGIDESLQEGIILASKNEKAGAGTGSIVETAIMHTVENGGYGRAYGVAETTLSSLVCGMQTVFESNRIIYFGEGNKRVSRVASFCGSGADEESVAFAVRTGADTVVSSDFKHHVISLAMEKGLSVIALTHYASENYGLEKYYEKIRRQVNVPCAFVTQYELL